MFVLKRNYEKLLKGYNHTLEVITSKNSEISSLGWKTEKLEEQKLGLELEVETLKSDRSALISKVGVNESLSKFLSDATDNMTANYIIDKLEEIHSNDAILLSEYKAKHENEMLSMSKNIERLSEENERLSGVAELNGSLLEKVNDMEGELAGKVNELQRLAGLQEMLASSSVVVENYIAEHRNAYQSFIRNRTKAQSTRYDQLVLTDGLEFIVAASARLESQTLALEKEISNMLSNLKTKDSKIKELENCLERFSSITPDYSLILKSINELQNVRQKIIDYPEVKKARNRIMNGISAGEDAFLEAKARELKVGILTSSDIDTLFSQRKKYMPDVDTRKQRGSTDGLNTQGGHDPYR